MVLRSTQSRSAEDRQVRPRPSSASSSIGMATASTSGQTRKKKNPGLMDQIGQFFGGDKKKRSKVSSSTSVSLSFRQQVQVSRSWSRSPGASLGLPRSWSGSPAAGSGLQQQVWVLLELGLPRSWSGSLGPGLGLPRSWSRSLGTGVGLHHHADGTDTFQELPAVVKAAQTHLAPGFCSCIS